MAAITVECIEKLLSNIKVNKASGPDNILCRILQELSAELATMLTVIFQQSLSTGKLPSDWLKAEVFPIFKKGSKNLAVNYRPISLTCVSCKRFEHIISKHIRNHLDFNMDSNTYILVKLN